MSRHTLGYYTKKVPSQIKDSCFNSFEETLNAYTVWKKEIADYYIENEELKQEDPEVYDILINTELTDKEIKVITEAYQKEKVITYSDKLMSDEYDLD
ncbi:hypothetical protein FACS1894142_4990 [Spirochaetia bacterium]|nr:hypothetical protein FACS1894142_4990 [Spirochaetia bacterium]